MSGIRRELPTRIALIGLRGAGKTTVGRELAKLLRYDCIDTDTLIEQKTGKSVAQIFAEDGEPAFRTREREAIAASCRRERIVISAGGGAVLDPETRKTLKAAAACIWLTAEVDDLLRRLATDKRSATGRPALTSRSPADELRLISDQRQPLYKDLAEIRIETSGKSIVEVAEEIFRRISPAS